MQRRQLVQLAGAALAASALSSRAQSFPVKPIRLVIAFPAGGPTDITMRSLADGASRILGQSVIVENKPGINWDPIKDISYVLNVTGYAFGLVVPIDSPLKTWTHYVGWAKANPGKLSFGSTSPHPTMELIAQKLGLQLLHVPYKGSADLMTALMGGHIMSAADSTGQVSGCADAHGTGAGPGAELAFWHWCIQRDTAGCGQAFARRLQAGDGAGQLQDCLGALRHGAHVHEFRRLQQVCGGDLRSGKALVEKLGLAKVQ